SLQGSSRTVGMGTTLEPVVAPAKSSPPDDDEDLEWPYGGTPGHRRPARHRRPRPVAHLVSRSRSGRAPRWTGSDAPAPARPDLPQHCRSTAVRHGGPSMKFRVARDDLADAVAWVAKSLPSRPPVPVLGGILLEVQGSTLTVAGFDYEVSTRAELSVDAQDDGRVLVSGRLLSEIT